MTNGKGLKKRDISDFLKELNYLHNCIYFQRQLNVYMSGAIYYRFIPHRQIYYNIGDSFTLSWVEMVL